MVPVWYAVVSPLYERVPCMAVPGMVPVGEATRRTLTKKLVVVANNFGAVTDFI
jgi:hypothetical protein